MSDGKYSDGLYAIIDASGAFHSHCLSEGPAVKSAKAMGGSVTRCWDLVRIWPPSDDNAAQSGETR